MEDGWLERSSHLSFTIFLQYKQSQHSKRILELEGSNDRGFSYLIYWKKPTNPLRKWRAKESTPHPLTNCQMTVRTFCLKKILLKEFMTLMVETCRVVPIPWPQLKIMVDDVKLNMTSNLPLFCSFSYLN